MLTSLYTPSQWTLSGTYLQYIVTRTTWNGLYSARTIIMLKIHISTNYSTIRSFDMWLFDYTKLVFVSALLFISCSCEIQNLEHLCDVPCTIDWLSFITFSNVSSDGSGVLNNESEWVSERVRERESEWVDEWVGVLDILCNGTFFERDRKYMNILDVSMSTLVALYLTDLYHQVP